MPIEYTSDTNELSINAPYDNLENQLIQHFSANICHLALCKHILFDEPTIDLSHYLTDQVMKIIVRLPQLININLCAPINYNSLQRLVAWIQTRPITNKLDYLAVFLPAPYTNSFMSLAPLGAHVANLALTANQINDMEVQQVLIQTQGMPGFSEIMFFEPHNLSENIRQQLPSSQVYNRFRMLTPPVGDW